MKVPVEPQQRGGGGQPRATLTVFDAVAMIVGIVIGVGIFKTPADVAGSAGSDLILIALWLVGGVISLAGALCYAELGSAHPNAGGEYYFLSKAYGDWLGFLYAWARMTVIQTGAIAAIAYAFGDYASTLLSLGSNSSAIYAAIAVIAITAINIVGTSESKWVQNTLTTALAFAVIAVVVSGLTATPAAPIPTPNPASEEEQGMALIFKLLNEWGLALIFVLFTYGGWNEAAYLTAEMRDTRRNIVRALVIGIVAITVLYVLLNLAYLNALGLAGMKASKVVASDLMKVSFGEGGAVVLSLIVIAAALSTMNGTIFTGARTNYALGRDFVIFRALGRWDEKASAPVNALLTQGVITIGLVLLASFTPDGFQTMVVYTTTAFWLFFLLTGISLFLLRRQTPANTNPFRVPLYPLTPLLFCGVCAYMVYRTFKYAMSLDPGSIGAMVGIAMLASGVPVLMWARRVAASPGRG